MQQCNFDTAYEYPNHVEQCTDAAHIASCELWLLPKGKHGKHAYFHELNAEGDANECGAKDETCKDVAQAYETTAQ